MSTPLLRIAGSDRGAAMLECAIVVPFLLIIFSGVIELTRILYCHERQSLLSREVSMQAWRSCQGALDPTANEQCLRQVLLDIAPLATNLDSAAKLILTTFKLDSGGTVVRLASQAYPNDQVITDHSLFTSPPATGFEGLKQKDDIAVVGEAIGSWEPLLKGLSVGRSLGKRWIYEATIF